MSPFPSPDRASGPMGALLVLLAVVSAAGAGWLAAPTYVASRLNPTLAGAVHPPTDEAERIHASLGVADLHTDALLWDRDLLRRSTGGHLDLPRLREGRVAVQLFSAVVKVPRGLNIDRNEDDSDLIALLASAQRWPLRTWFGLTDRALYQVERLARMEARSGGALRIARTRGDLEDTSSTVGAAAQDAGGVPWTVTAVLSVEGGQALEGQLENLDRLFDAGVRALGLVHFVDNELGGSAHGVARGGLTPFGAAVVARMEELGMVVDLAHASAALLDDVTAVVTRPLIVSHGGPMGRCANARTLEDRQLAAVARTGGVVGIGLWPEAVCGETVGAWAASVRYVADRVGVEHVALGSDWDGAVEAIVDPSGTVHLVDALLSVGFDEVEIRAILRENALRVLRDILPEATPSGPS